jgi:putative transposase
VVDVRLGNLERIGIISPEYSLEQFTAQHRQWVSDAIVNGCNQREKCWTESIAIGSSSFVEETKIKLGTKAIGRRVEEQRNDQYVLREEPVAYNTVFDPEKGLLSSENSYFWDINSYNLDG